MMMFKYVSEYVYVVPEIVVYNNNIVVGSSSTRQAHSECRQCVFWSCKQHHKRRDVPAAKLFAYFLAMLGFLGFLGFLTFLTFLAYMYVCVHYEKEFSLSLSESSCSDDTEQSEQ